MRSYFAAFLLMTTAPLAALWLNYPTPGIPRTPDGKPNLSAPAPRTADGKPDLSGIWDPDKYYLANANLGIAPGMSPIVSMVNSGASS